MRGNFVKSKNKSHSFHVLFAFYAIPNILRIKQFGGGLSKIKNKYLFMFYLRFMLFPTFLVNYLLVFFCPKYKDLISCFVRVNNAKLGYRYEGGGRDGSS